jgi:hypothetical protein
MGQALRIGQIKTPCVAAENGHDGALQGRRREDQPRVWRAAIAQCAWCSHQGIRALDFGGHGGAV